MREMKLKAIVAAAALGLLGASVAFAAPPPGKGNPHSTSTTTTTTTTASQGKKPACRAYIAVVLKGSLAADGAAAPSSLSVTVKGGNHFAAAYKKAAQPVAVAVTAQTKVRRQGKTAPTDLRTGDLVNVQARACKADLAHDATPALTAVRVSAHAPATS